MINSFWFRLNAIFLLCVFVLSSSFSADIPTQQPSNIIETEECAAIVLGGGISGMTAATYLSRAGLKTVVITGPSMGGAIALSSDVQNWPGEVSISGFELSEKVARQADLNGAVFRQETIVSVDLSQRPFIVTTKSFWRQKQKQYRATSCIIALGGQPNLLNVEGERLYFGRGVHTCAVCDASMYRDQTVAVVGGGDSAVLEAEYLSPLVKKVVLILRNDHFRASDKRRLQELLKRPNVEVIYNTVIEKIEGDGEQPTHLLTINQKTKKSVKLPVNALFLAIGFHPNTDLFLSPLEKDERGYVILKKGQETSVDGVYAVGDVADPRFRQAITAAGDAAKAAIQIIEDEQVDKSIAQAPLAVFEKRLPILEITSKEELTKLLKKTSGPVFIDFYSTQCAPCRFFAPLFEVWAQEFLGKITFIKANAEFAPELFDAYHVTHVPTLLILDKQGTSVRKCTGSKQIAEMDECLETMKEKDRIIPEELVR